MTDRTNMEALGEALSATVDRFVADRTDVTTIDVCSALGLVAGIVVANTIPVGAPDLDDLAVQAAGHMFGEALQALRQRRAN